LYGFEEISYTCAKLPFQENYPKIALFLQLKRLKELIKVSFVAF